jgi:hypothetical protein
LGEPLCSFGAVSPGDAVTVDVGAGLRAGGRVAFAIASDGADATWFTAKEAGDGSGAAVLSVTLGAGDTGSSPGAGDTGSASDTGVVVDDWEPRPDRNAEKGEPDEAACGCTSAGARGVGGAAAALVLALRRRRARAA